jgi:hypothetical protein
MSSTFDSNTAEMNAGAVQANVQAQVGVWGARSYRGTQCGMTKDLEHLWHCSLHDGQILAVAAVEGLVHDALNGTRRLCALCLSEPTIICVVCSLQRTTAASAATTLISVGLWQHGATHLS